MSKEMLRNHIWICPKCKKKSVSKHNGTLARAYGKRHMKRMHPGENIEPIIKLVGDK